MGACSSKPKTTEFEGSTEPSKKTEDVASDRSIDAVNAAQVSHQNEPGKENPGAADVGAEFVQETRSLISSKDEEPLIKELLSTAEGVSYSVKTESIAVDGEAGESAAEKVKADVGDAQKGDAGDGVTDYKEVSERATTVGDGVGGDQEKLFEDKAIVLDEAGNGVVGKGDAYIDKAVAADEEKAHESSDKGSGSVTAQDEESRNLQDINGAPGVESPIIGVVHFAEPIHVDDVSESVGSATPENTAHVDSKVSKPPDEIERDVLTGPNIGENGIPSMEEAANLLSGSPEKEPEEKEEVLLDGLPQEAPEEKEEVLHDGSPEEAPEEKEEVLHDGSKGSPPVVCVSDGVGQESGVNDARGKEAPLASADAQDETSLDDTTKPETIEDPQHDIEESTSERQEESSLEDSARESHVAEVTEKEGNAGVLDEPEPEAPKLLEGIDAETSMERKAETTLEQAIEGQVEGIVDEPKASDVQPQALAVEETAEDGKREATPDEAIAEASAETDREEKVEKPHIEEATTNKLKEESLDAAIAEPSAETDREEKIEKPHIEEATENELKVESVDAGNLESSGEGDVAFEDASYVSLKVESSTIESGDKPNP